MTRSSAGGPCIRHDRLQDGLDLLAARVPEVEILEDYLFLEPQNILACLAYAAAQTDYPVLVAA